LRAFFQLVESLAETIELLGETFHGVDQTALRAP
jgi:hypothetical protein